MKPSEIIVGHKYQDHYSMRTVMEIVGDRVKWISDLDTNGECSLRSFARWSISEIKGKNEAK